MAQELELKLSLPPAAQQQLLQHPLLEQLSIASIEHRQLFNIYFDTPEQSLNKQRIALRIRRQNERYIQTLKTKGNSRGGLHQRQEWEWDLAEPVLDLSLLPLQFLPDGIDWAKVQPAFNTDFSRTAWQLEVKAEGRQAHIELVLDSGCASCKQKHLTDRDTLLSDPISEIELELMSGDPLLIFNLALELVETIPLRITQVSKAERGYRLQQSTSSQAHPGHSASNFANDSPVEKLAYLLESIQGQVERFELTNEGQDLYPLMQHLQGLLALLSCPPFPIASTTMTQLTNSCHQLQELIAPWILEQQYSVELADDQDCQQRLKRCRDLLQGLAFAQCLLQLSYQLFLDSLE